MFRMEKLLSRYSNRRAIIWQSFYENQHQFNYDEIIEATKTVTSTLQEFIKKGNNVGVLLHHSAEIVPVILGILDLCATFCCLNRNESSAELKDVITLFRCNIGVADKLFMLKHSKSKEYEILKEFKIFNKSLVILRLLPSDSVTGNNSPCSYIEAEDIFQSSRIMFCCSTSGTSGQPKLVQVPFKCLWPNVISLSKHYGLTQSDVIYISSPPTFDPFVVDLFLGLSNGATILMVSNEIRLSTKLLLPLFEKNSITVMQITPSLFRRFPIESIQNLLSSASTLRCLILGGEPFPSMEEVALWFRVNDEIEMHTKLFNIYGITEVSCWSTIHEITLMDIECRNSVPIGSPLDSYTTLKVIDCVNREIIENGIGELFIESIVRQCVIHENGKPHNVLGRTATGDLVEIKLGTIYYKTRVNNMVKIFGHKVNLTKIENVTKSNWPVNDACCVYDKDKNSVILFVIQSVGGRKCTKKEILQGLRQKLLQHEIPSLVHFVDQFPLSCHGKISKSKLLEMIEKPLGNFLRDTFVDKLEENLPNFDAETSKELTFIAAGGSSILALQLINELETKFNFVDLELITMMLSPSITLEQIISHLQNCRSNNLKETTSSQKIQSMPFEWCHDFEKCIDASSSICIVDNRNIVSVGSHSHKLLNIDLVSGQVLSKLTLPHRIECQVIQFKNYGIIGCYDGFLYCFDIRNGLEKWKFDSKGMIKSKSCIVGNFVVFGNYNSESNLCCLRADDGSLIWNRKIGDKSIYAGIVETTNNNLFVTTLDGVCAVIEPLTGLTLWETKLQSPIFSTVKIQGNRIFIAEVLGIVHNIDLSSGKILCSFKAGGNIYSSIESIDDNLICFGCYDKSIYCLSFEADALMFELRWKVDTSGQIFSSPKNLRFESTNLILACSTNGVVCIVNLNGEILKQFQINGEIFSTPSVADSRVIIASRNNLLYCFDLQKILAKNQETI